MNAYGPYQLLGRLATGGMSEVFLATHHARPDRRLVVKRILPHLGDRPQFVRMFLDEARLTSQLHHDNVVRIEDFGEAEGVHYIAMEYVDGLSLRRLVQRLMGQRLRSWISCYIVAEACAALDYAHNRADPHGEPLRIVHRDVSPENVLLSKAGQVKLADFGIAKAASQLHRTRPGQFKGKLSYMSPEQVMQRPTIDHRSDIFSSGAMLYELTVGRRLFDAANDAVVLNAIVHGEYPPPFEPDFPRELAAIIGRAVAKEPDQRYQDAATMRADLLALVPERADPAAQLALLVRHASGGSDELPRADGGPSTEVATPTGEVTDLGLGPLAPAAPSAGPLHTIKGMPAPRVAAVDVADTVRSVPVFDPEDAPTAEHAAIVQQGRAPPGGSSSPTVGASASAATTAVEQSGGQGLIEEDDDGPPPISRGPSTVRIRFDGIEQGEPPELRRWRWLLAAAVLGLALLLFAWLAF